MAMQNENRTRAAAVATGISSRKALLIGIAGTVAAAAWAMRQQRTRRYADRGIERRDPMSFFLAGRHPHRRKIDRDGTHPVFERRQSVYDTY